MSAAEIQPPNLAGTWYPADAEELRADVERFLGDRRVEPEVHAILAPHAGYRYSGKAAGSAFARIQPGRWRRGVIVAPSHYHSFRGAAVFPGSGFETPLGIVRVDRDGARALGEQPLFSMTATPYAREHSLEIELPFLQVVDPALPIVPVLVGDSDVASDVATIASGLATLDDGHTLFVVSSDFTHYGAHFDYLPFPSDAPESVSAALRKLDYGAIEPICRGDAPAFRRYVRATGITVCGRGPIAAFLEAESGRVSGDVVDYYTSLDVTGDFTHSVSYAGIAFRHVTGNDA